MLVEEKNASLSTLSVTIQALHVQGKQMTLAVFRQLPTMIANENCSIWGIVRYEIKDSGDLWLVFSFNNCLYRMRIDLHSYINYYQEKINKIKKAIDDSLSYYKIYNPTEYEIRKERLSEEMHIFNEELQEEKERLELHQYYANNYPQLFIAV